MSGYNVVLRARSGKNQGVVTWTSFSDKEAFESKYDDAMCELYQVLAEGVSEEEATRYAQATPRHVRQSTALAVATEPDTGAVDLGVLAMELGNLRYL